MNDLARQQLLLTPEQERVTHYFDSVAHFWKKIYEERGVFAAIHRERKALALRWIKELELPLDRRILEVGCGAGSLAIALATAGYRLDAIDSSPQMLSLTQSQLLEQGMEDRITATLGDVHSLHSESNRFDLLVAMGVVPWLHSPALALREMSRVLRPGGYVLLNADNLWRMVHLIDPTLNPLAKAAARISRRALTHLGLIRQNDGIVKMHSLSQFDRMLATAGLRKIKACTIGFGPFSFFRKVFVPEPLGMRLHARLQRIADKGVLPIKYLGSQYVVLAVKE